MQLTNYLFIFTLAIVTFLIYPFHPHCLKIRAMVNLCKLIINNDSTLNISFDPLTYYDLKCFHLNRTASFWRFDDFSIFYSHKYLELLVDNLNDEFKKVTTWLKSK